jgi:hypothetical protein
MIHPKINTFQRRGTRSTLTYPVNRSISSPMRMTWSTTFEINTGTISQLKRQRRRITITTLIQSNRSSIPKVISTKTMTFTRRSNLSLNCQSDRRREKENTMDMMSYSNASTPSARYKLIQFLHASNTTRPSSGKYLTRSAE